jgi:drug/metabolite transporter (DMT)-like permease
VVTYLVPVIAALLEVAILGEPWTWLSTAIAGLRAILTGVS